MYRFAMAVRAKLGLQVACSLLLITATQFHLPFYMSRPLPNTFALILTLNAYADWLQLRTRRLVWTLAFAAVSSLPPASRQSHLPSVPGLCICMAEFTKHVSWLLSSTAGASASLVSSYVLAVKCSWVSQCCLLSCVLQSKSVATL